MTNRDAPEFVGVGGEFPFEAVQRQIATRRALLADEMKKRQRVPNMPEGSMVGNRYVAPHWLSQIAAASGPLIDRMGMQMLNQQDQNQSAQLSAADALASAAHQARMPVTRTEQDLPQDIGGNMIQGPARDITPTPQEKIQWANQGMNIPSRREMLTRLVQDQTIQEPIREEGRVEKRSDREDRQQEIRNNLEAGMVLKREQAAAADLLAREKLTEQAKEAARRSEDTRLSIEQRREAAKNHDALMRTLQGLKPAKQLPISVHKDLSELESASSNLESLAGSFNPKDRKEDYSGIAATVRNKMAPYDPTGSLDNAGAQWWKAYQKQAALAERHAMFGATLTGNEKEAWDLADINMGMNEKTIKANLKIRADLAKKVYGNAVDRYEKAGHTDVRKVFDAAVPRSVSGTSGSWDGGPNASVAPTAGNKPPPPTRRDGIAKELDAKGPKRIKFGEMP